jgi:hypothetical protein
MIIDINDIMVTKPVLSLIITTVYADTSIFISTIHFFVVIQCRNGRRVLGKTEPRHIGGSFIQCYRWRGFRYRL